MGAGTNNVEMQSRQKMSADWFRQLRDSICAEFMAIEREFAGGDECHSIFKRDYWERDGGGGGEISLMKGRVFEKVGVNISTVHGEFLQEFAKEIPGAVQDPSFWASGISIVAHMCSPKVPAVHMNTRFICTSKHWFGGGMDLTPMYYNDSDAVAFHAHLEAVCDKFDRNYYPKFKANADQYFYLKNRSEPRGIGGIFYDYLDSGSWEEDFAYTQAVGKGFLEIYPKIVRRNMYRKWTEEQRSYQLLKRGRYAEFNLLYDRGVRFGLMTGGNVDAIMMSMPPMLSW